MANNLSTTEFTITRKAAQSWTNQGIADHQGFSPNRVKRYSFNAMTTLKICHRHDLKIFMLHCFFLHQYPILPLKRVLSSRWGACYNNNGESLRVFPA